MTWDAANNKIEIAMDAMRLPPGEPVIGTLAKKGDKAEKEED